MVIATKSCFIVAERVESITLEQAQEEDFVLATRRQKGKRRKKNHPLLVRHTLRIVFEPKGKAHNYREVIVSTYDSERATTLYQEVVRQWREQNPDEIYLDKIAESILGGEE
jgi:hypothetical protein